MQTLLVLQSLWAMEGLTTPGRSLEADLDLIAANGFDGVGAAMLDDAGAAQVARLCTERQLAIEGVAFPDSIDALKPALELAARYGILQLNIQPDARPVRFAEAVNLVEGWLRLAEQVDFPVNIETHRNKLTNDMLFTLALLERLPNMRLTADLSHYVVAREITLPLTPETEQRIARILDHSWALHGRVATSSQVQVPVAFAQHAQWLDQYIAWWRQGVTSWRKRAGQNARLAFLCELGPAPYAITDGNGRELSDRWEDALQLAALARLAWTETLRPDHPTMKETSAVTQIS